MKEIQSNGYSIFFDEEGFLNLSNYIEIKKYSSVFILVDSNTNEFCLSMLSYNLAIDIKIEIIEIEPGEIHKNIETCVEIWNILTDFGADRKSLLINLGGGVITDIGGFIASTFKRGIDFVNIPTTLLSMVDASIGGKNGIDLGKLKNQIGVINDPKMVIINSNYLETLPQNEMRSGLAEMLKHGLIADESYWNSFKNLDNLQFEDLNKLIYHSVEIKNKIVLEDPTENGIRKSLNFGHTLGHAIESYFLDNPEKQSILHGEAVAAGMILESYISYKKNYITEKEYFIIKKTIFNFFERLIINEEDISQITKLLIHDKKNEYGKIKFTLLEKIGKCIINQEVELELILNSFKDYFS